MLPQRNDEGGLAGYNKLRVFFLISFLTLMCALLSWYLATQSCRELHSLAHPASGCESVVREVHEVFLNCNDLWIITGAVLKYSLNALACRESGSFLWCLPL